MSSLAAAGADGYYNPPDWDPQRDGPRNKYVGSRGNNQWLLSGKLRFELPFNCWCGGCKRAIGQGTRYNATKVSAGKYHSTTIWEFGMKCSECPQLFVIRTDPQGRDYVCVSGLTRMHDKSESLIEIDASGSSANPLTPAEAQARMARTEDPLATLDHEIHTEKEAKQGADRMTQLIAQSNANHSDPFAVNSYLRQHARRARKAEQQREKDGKRLCLPYPLLPDYETSDDSQEQEEQEVSPDNIQKTGLGSGSDMPETSGSRDADHNNNVGDMNQALFSARNDPTQARVRTTSATVAARRALRQARRGRNGLRRVIVSGETKERQRMNEIAKESIFGGASSSNSSSRATRSTNHTQLCANMNKTNNASSRQSVRGSSSSRSSSTPNHLASIRLNVPGTSRLGDSRLRGSSEFTSGRSKRPISRYNGSKSASNSSSSGSNDGSKIGGNRSIGGPNGLGFGVNGHFGRSVGSTSNMSSRVHMNVKMGVRAGEEEEEKEKRRRNGITNSAMLSKARGQVVVRVKPKRPLVSPIRVTKRMKRE